MSNREFLYLDPFFSANIYCANLLDELIHEAILPFWLSLRGIHRDCYIWIARYMRGGEHLKIRVHGHAELRGQTEILLNAAVGRFLEAHYNERQTQSNRESYSDQFPVDPEDECTTAYPDHTILLTRYRRVPGIIGRQPLANDERLTALFIRSIGLGTEIILERFKPDHTGLFQGKLRMSLALRFFAGALSVFGSTSELSAVYLKYHQELLLLLLKGDRARMEEQFRALPVNIEGTTRYLRSALTYDNKSCPDNLHPLYQEWLYSFEVLFRYTVQLSNCPAYLRDEHMKDQVLATPFKLLHALANQVGLGALNELYLCHLLLQALPEGQPDDTGENAHG
jgi:Lantibiotic biosynthesis dehydratase C-term